MLTVGSLFAGIGGFDLGLERTGGFEVRWQVEIDDYCRRVLERHWPHVRRYGDIRTVTDVERVDVLCGGFPCQDISNAGKRAGIDGERSGLWSEYVRIIRLVRPRYVLVENVAALLGRGMGRVLGDLSESGYDAEWETLSGCSLGAPHSRERVFLIAYPTKERSISSRMEGSAETFRRIRDRVSRQWGTDWIKPEMDHSNAVAATWGPEIQGITQPCLIGMVDRDAIELDRSGAIGNAVMPELAEWIGSRILEHERLATGAGGGD